MRSARSWLCRGLLLLAVAGCSHGSSTGRQELPAPRATEDSEICTRCGDSATLHIQALIAQGQLRKAEAYLVQAIAAGLLSREAATRLQEKLAERNQQQSPESDRRAPPRNEFWGSRDPEAWARWYQLPPDGDDTSRFKTLVAAAKEPAVMQTERAAWLEVADRLEAALREG